MTTQADFLFRRLRLRHIQLLTLLAEKGSVRGAADAMLLSQPAVSKMLKEVEIAFGERLFERDQHGVKPNAYGLAAIRRARVVLNELQVVTQELQAIRGGGGLLRLGSLSISELAPTAIAGLLQRMPGARIYVREGTVVDLVNALLDGELDCVFGALGASALQNPLVAELSIEVVMENRLSALLSVNHVLARKKKLRWADLQNSRWVVPPRSTIIGQAFVSAFTNIGLPPVPPVLEALSPVTMRSVLAADPTLIGVARQEYVATSVSLGGLRWMDMDPLIALPPLCFITRHSAVAGPAIAQYFLEELRLAAGKHGRQAA